MVTVAPNATELFTLKWLILCHINFYSINYFIHLKLNTDAQKCGH